MTSRVLYRTRDGVVHVDFGRAASRPSVEDEAQAVARWLEEVARRRDEQQRVASLINWAITLGAVLAFLGVLAWMVP